jgi:hypothetical protein
MATSRSFGGKAALVLAAACGSGGAMAAMPGLYFSGFYMDSTLAYSSADVSVPQFEAARADVWSEYGYEVVDTQESAFDRTDIGFSFALGYQFSQYLAAELAYVQMGDTSFEAIGTVRFVEDGFEELSRTVLVNRARGLALSGVAVWPLSDSWSLDARAGMLFGKSKLKYSVEVETGGFDVSSLSGDSTAVMLGAGVNWAMSPGTAIRAGYTRLEQALYGDRDVSSWTLSLKYAW